MTIIEIETCGVGFLPDARPAILFERHVFSRRTGGRFDFKYGDISNPNPGGYGGYGTPQYQKLNKAMQLDERSALESCSWGLGQIMGFNYNIAGYTSVESMILDFCDSEDAQLMGVAIFIYNAGLVGVLRAHDWTAFAKRYNGPTYAKNSYDSKLRDAYTQWSRAREPNCAVRAQQINLSYMGYYKGKIDGISGPRTKAALELAMSDGRVPKSNLA